MIVQSAAAGAAHFVLTMAEHTAFAGRLAAAFGNARFEAVEPREPMLYVIGHHDAGWRELDAAALRDPATGLPYNLVQTPFARIVETSSASPDFNSAHHSYCGLISSMHSWGLYNGRYGMSDVLLLDQLADANRALADGMLDCELKRQARLKAELANDPQTAAWLDEPRLFQNYKQLQFFDTMALYFNCVHEGARPEASFTHVPMDREEDTTVTVKPLGGGVYALDPFPFAAAGLEVSFDGRYLTPVATGPSVRATLDRAAPAAQTMRLVAAA